MKDNAKNSIVFYSTLNVCSYDRHDFDNVCGNPDELASLLAKLVKGEYEIVGWSDEYDDADYDADVFNDWDDEVKETMEWTDEELVEQTKMYAKMTGHPNFGTWIKTHWAIAVPMSADELKAKVNGLHEKK